MKIISNNAAYIQKNDINYLIQNDIIPEAMINKICKDSNDEDVENKYDFIKFTDFETVEFLKNLDCIIDYFRIKDLDEKDIVKLGKIIVEKKKEINSILKTMNDDEKKNSSLTKQYNFLNTKLLSLKDALWIKRGIVEFDIPNEIDVPINEVKENSFKKALKKILKKY